MQHISLNSLAHCDYLIAWPNDNACQAAIVQLYMDLFNLTQNKRSFEFDIWKLFFFHIFMCKEKIIYFFKMFKSFTYKNGWNASNTNIEWVKLK